MLPCDHEVTGSSPGNSLLQKCRVRLRTIDPKRSDPPPDPAQAGATCTGLPFFFAVPMSIYVLYLSEIKKTRTEGGLHPCLILIGDERLEPWLPRGQR